jgi:hypothetical protein
VKNVENSPLVEPTVPLHTRKVVTYENPVKAMDWEDPAWNYFRTKVLRVGEVKIKEDVFFAYL